MNRECIFCNYQENKNDIIFENDYAFAVFNFKPSVSGHALIFPKKHIEDIIMLQGNQLNDVVQAVPNTFEFIKNLFENDINYLETFYENILKNSTDTNSLKYVERVLKTSCFKDVPTAYNWGMNYGFEAGQRAPHLHFHLFPRVSGLGLANAIREAVI